MSQLSLVVMGLNILKNKSERSETNKKLCSKEEYLTIQS